MEAIRVAYNHSTYRTSTMKTSILQPSTFTGAPSDPESPTFSHSVLPQTNKDNR